MIERSQKEELLTLLQRFLHAKRFSDKKEIAESIERFLVKHFVGKRDGPEEKLIREVYPELLRIIYFGREGPALTDDEIRDIIEVLSRGLLPRTSVIYNYHYAKEFHSELSPDEFEEIREKCRDFERFHRNNISEILYLVQRFTGFRWKREFIPIYIIKSEAPLFLNDPLTISYLENKNFMKVMLVEELIENIWNERVVSKELRNAVVHRLTREIMRRTGPNLEPEVERCLSFLGRRKEWLLSEKLEWNPEEKSAKEFVEEKGWI